MSNITAYDELIKALTTLVVKLLFPVCRISSITIEVWARLCVFRLVRLSSVRLVNSDGLCCTLTRPCRKIEPTVPGDRHGLIELERSQLIRTELLGRGNYGEVFRGKYGQRDVAIKCMKTDNKNRVCNVDKFLEEAKIMKDLLHKNIVRLYGVCAQEEPIFIVTEFMANGCLLNYLRDGPGKNLKFKTILDFAAQVSEGQDWSESMSNETNVFRLPKEWPI